MRDAAFKTLASLHSALPLSDSQPLLSRLAPRKAARVHTLRGTEPPDAAESADSTIPPGGPGIASGSGEAQGTASGSREAQGEAQGEAQDVQDGSGRETKRRRVTVVEMPRSAATVPRSVSTASRPSNSGQRSSSRPAEGSARGGMALAPAARVARADKRKATTMPAERVPQNKSRVSFTPARVWSKATSSSRDKTTAAKHSATSEHSAAAPKPLVPPESGTPPIAAVGWEVAAAASSAAPSSAAPSSAAPSSAAADHDTLDDCMEWWDQITGVGSASGHAHAAVQPGSASRAADQACRTGQTAQPDSVRKVRPRDAGHPMGSSEAAKAAQTGPEGAEPGRAAVRKSMAKSMAAKKPAAVSRKELSRWVAEVTQQSVTQLEKTCASGAVYCLLLDSARPGSVDMRKVSLSAEASTAYGNYRALGNALSKLGLEKARSVDTQLLQKGQPQATIELLQTLHASLMAV